MSSPSVPVGSRPGGGAFSVEMALQVLLSALLIGPAVIHATLGGSALLSATAVDYHVALALLEGLLAVTVLMTLSRPLVFAIIGVGLSTALIWTLGRTGLPVGALGDIPRQTGLAGAICAVLQLAGAGAAAVCVLSPYSAPLAARLRRPVAEGRFLTLLLVTAVAAAVLSYVGVLDSLTRAGG